MINVNDLKNGSFIIINKDPYVVLLVKHQHIGRGGSSAQTKIRNLRTGQVLDRNFKPSDQFEEADMEKVKVKFIYGNRGQFWFNDNSGIRFSLDQEIIGNAASFLKPNLEVIALKFNGNIINIELPIKIDYKVVEAPPAVKGNTAQGSTKTIILETKLKVQVPLFINEGDIVRINTQTGEYSERIEKS